MEIETEYVTVHVSDGFITLLENHYLRKSFDFNEQISLETNEKIIPFGRPSSQGKSRVREKLNDFISGLDQAPFFIDSTKYIQRWEFGNFYIVREILVSSHEYNDGHIFFRFLTNSKNNIKINWKTSLKGKSFGINKKRTVEYKFLQNNARFSCDFFKNNRIYIGEEIPPQELFCYFDYKDETLSVNFDEEESLSASFSLRNTEKRYSIFLLFQIIGTPYSNTLFLVEKENWKGALSSIIFQKSFDDTINKKPFYRWTFKPFSIFLWYNPGEGILHYQRLLIELPGLQEIFVFGKISHADYRLLKHVLTQKERLSPQLNPLTGEYENPSKIFVVYHDDDDKSYSKYIMNFLKSEIQYRQTDYLISGLNPYVPRTEPIIMREDESHVFQYKKILEKWFYDRIISNHILFIIPEDPILAGIAAYFARYLNAYVCFYEEDGEPFINPLELDALFNIFSNQDKFYAYLIIKKDKTYKELADTLTESFGNISLHTIEYVNYYDLAGIISIMLLKYKVFDKYFSRIDSNSDKYFQVAVENCLSEEIREDFSIIKKEIIESKIISFDKLEATYKKIPSDFYVKLLINLGKKGIGALSHYLSPNNEPLLLPQLILSSANRGLYFNLFTASNFASYKLSPVLLIKQPDDSSIAMQFYRDLFELKEQASGKSYRDYIQALKNIILETNRKILELYTNITLEYFGLISPLFITFLTEDNITPYEITTFYSKQPKGIRISSEITDDSFPNICYLYRVGRLTADTNEMTCRLVAQSVLNAHSYKGQFRICSFSNPNNDLSEAENESMEIIDLFEKISADNTFDALTFQKVGFECNKHSFIEITNNSIDFLHFAGHCKSSIMDPFESYLKLSDSRITSLEIANDLSLFKNPIIFLNACESGRGPGSIATSFFRAFAGSVIGTIWPVFDKEARIFGKFLLALLLNGVSLGSALQSAKQYTRYYIKQKQEEDNLSWYSYVIYGDPCVIPYISFYKDPGYISKAIDHIMKS